MTDTTRITFQQIDWQKRQAIVTYFGTQESVYILVTNNSVSFIEKPISDGVIITTVFAGRGGDYLCVHSRHIIHDDLVRYFLIPQQFMGVAVVDSGPED
jgi:hypothetical protein